MCLLSVWNAALVSVFSRLKNPSFTCLLPFIYTDFEVDLTSGIIKGSSLSPGFTWSIYVRERAGVFNVLFTQCIYFLESTVFKSLRLAVEIVAHITLAMYARASVLDALHGRYVVKT